jgi:hypothetical protein
LGGLVFFSPSAGRSLFFLRMCTCIYISRHMHVYSRWYGYRPMNVYSRVGV